MLLLPTSDGVNTLESSILKMFCLLLPKPGMKPLRSLEVNIELLDAEHHVAERLYELQ